MASSVTLPQGFTLDEPTQLPAGFTLDDPDQKPDMSDRIMRQLGLTVRAGGEGVAGTVGLVADPFAATLRSVINLGLENKIPHDSLQQVVGDFLTNMGVPNPENKTEEVVQRISQAVTGAGTGAGVAKKVFDVGKGVTKEVARQLAAQPVAQLTGAASAQASSEAAREAGYGEGVQTIASLLGGTIGAGLTSKLTPTTNKAPILDDIAAAEKQGIRVMTSDVRTPDTFASKWLQSVGEKIPAAGTGPVRAAQHTERVSAIKNLAREFGADDVAHLSDDVMGDLIKTRSKMVKNLTNIKTQIFDKIEDAGTVPVGKTVAAIDREIAKLQSLGTSELKPAIAILQDWRSAVQGQGIKNVELLRKQLGQSFEAPNLAGVKDTASQSLNSIYGAVRDDIGEFVMDKGGAKSHKAWQAVNAKLANMMGDLNKNALKTALNKGEVTPELVRTLLFSKKPSDIKLLHNSLSNYGRASARASIIQEAVKKSLTDGEISPKKFATQMSKMNDQFGIFFKGKDKAQIKGLERALEMTHRASVAGINPPTGQQLSIPVVAAVLADLLGTAGGAIATGGGVGLMARLYESKPVRNALINLGRTKLGVKEEAAALKRLVASVQTFKRNETEAQ